MNRFYLAYQQKNDKEINEIYNQITTLLLGNIEQPNKIKNINNKKIGVISTFKYHPNLFIIEQLKQIDKNLQVVLIIINNPKIKLDGIPTNFKIDHLNIKLHLTRLLNLNVLSNFMIWE